MIFCGTVLCGKCATIEIPKFFSSRSPTPYYVEHTNSLTHAAEPSSCLHQLFSQQFNDAAKIHSNHTTKNLMPPSNLVDNMTIYNLGKLYCSVMSSRHR